MELYYNVQISIDGYVWENLATWFENYEEANRRACAERETCSLMDMEREIRVVAVDYNGDIVQERAA